MKQSIMEGGYHCTEVANEVNPSDPALIYLNNEHIDAETKKQVHHMICSYNLKHARVMPDCHVGQCCCIGFTSEFCMKAIVPSFVGGDIGCGILTYPLNKKKLNLIQLEKAVKSIVPMGSGHTHVHAVSPVEESFISRYLHKANQLAIQFAAQHNADGPKTIDYCYFRNLLDRIGMDEDVCLRSFGTLGGGNHFIEINQNTESLQYYLTIHSGSRAFGMKLFEHYNAMTVKSGSSDGQVKCLSASDSLSYCFDMIVAQQLAVMNRHIMLHLILRYMSIDFQESELIESIHNYLDFSRNILRKGAVSAENNQLCIVALNMKDGILICKGKGNSEWNYSCAHGCGRLYSRGQSRRHIRYADYKKVMSDVVSSSVCMETLDEAPQAYKDFSLIMEALEPTVEVVVHLISIVNWKGT